MSAHLRANLALVVLSLGLCCVAYPLVLWASGRAIFTTRASGDLIVEDGKVRGSRRIAQPFDDKKYFRPRPSAADYHASASSGSNYSANNPKLRDRVVRKLVPVVRYEAGGRAGPDVEKWFRDEPELLKKWIEERPAEAKFWADEKKVSVDELKAFAARHPRNWPEADEKKDEDGKVVSVSLKAVTPDPSGKEENADLQATLFEAWLAKHPDKARALRKVPADMVTMSGSGLDPHITLENALYQLDRVAKAWAEKRKEDRAAVRDRIEKLLRARSSSPLWGLAGEPLVNVVEVNRALDAELGHGR
jgi:K+-transporting ATPase ATPase C chain